MARRVGVKYGARDGLGINGYLTGPVGHQPKGLPLVVMPHGGPWVRDVWGYDPLVQLLANRGYAVLQMNYRGSTGYGDELYQEARKQIGGKIQDDIEDATRWAIPAGVADPQPIAIMGGSSGGWGRSGCRRICARASSPSMGSPIVVAASEMRPSMRRPSSGSRSPCSSITRLEKPDIARSGERRSCETE